MKKTLVLATCLSTAIALTSAAVNANPENSSNCEKHHAMDMKGKRHGPRMMGFAKTPESLERELTKEQIHTLMEARLIMKGNDNVKLGTITDSEDGFEVTIVTQDDSLVKTVSLAKNGMPQRMYNRIKARMEASEN